MTLSQVAAENEDQAAYWNGPSGVKWVDHQSQMDKVLDPLGQIALDVAGPDLGERIIDIGCGCGATSILLADRVGRQG